MAAVTLVTVLGVVALTRWRGPSSAIRLDLALAMLGGLFLGPVLVVLTDGGLLLSVLTGSGLVAASELLPLTGPRRQRLAAVGIGFVAFWVIWLVSLVFFYEAR